MEADHPDLTTLHVRKALDGDAASLEWIVGRFTPLLRAQAAYRLGAALARQVDPDDIVADAWMVGLQRLPEFDPGEKRSTPALLSYLAQTVRFVANNALRAHLRGERRKEARPRSGSDPLHELEDRVAGIVSEAARAEAGARITAAIGELEETNRTIVILRGIEGLANREIGEVLNEKPNTISHRYHRAVEQLRERLPGSVFEELVGE